MRYVSLYPPRPPLSAHWQNGAMALRWTAASFETISRGFRRIMGYKHFWMLKAALEEPSKDRSLVEQAKAG